MKGETLKDLHIRHAKYAQDVADNAKRRITTIMDTAKAKLLRLKDEHDIDVKEWWSDEEKRDQQWCRENPS